MYVICKIHRNHLLMGFTKLLFSLYGKEKPKVKYSALIQDKLLGGIGLPDLEARPITQRLVSVKRLLCGDFKPWKQTA